MKDTERTILLNQVAIMAALSCLLKNSGGSATGYFANELQQRINTSSTALKD